LDAGCVTNAVYFLVIRPTSGIAKACPYSFIGEKGQKLTFSPEKMNFWGIAGERLMEKDEHKAGEYKAKQAVRADYLP
jgi:hypothetical protein